MVVLAFYLVISLQSWGPLYGSGAALLAIAFVAYPAWALLVNTDESARAPPPTPRQIALAGTGLGLLVASSFLYTAWAWQDATFMLTTIPIALSVIPLLPYATRQLSASTRKPRSIPSDRGPLLRVLLLLVVLPVAALSVTLLVAPLVAWEPYQFTNFRDGFDRLADATETVLLPAATLGIPLVVSFFVGLAAASLQHHGFAVARERRRRNLEAVGDTAKALYGRGDLERDPYLALQSSIRMELEGSVPGEADLLQARTAMGAVLVLALAALIVAGLTLFTGLTTTELDLCTDCQNAADQSAFASAVSDWRGWMIGTVLLLGSLGLLALLFIPGLVQRIRNAQAETHAFRAEQQKLVATYLKAQETRDEQSLTTQRFG